MLQLNKREGLNCKVESEVFLLANRSLPSEGVRWRYCVVESYWKLVEEKIFVDILENCVVVEKGRK